MAIKAIGPRARMIVVADASPLNYLILIEEIALLSRLFENVLVPAGVAAELRNPTAPERVRLWITNPPRWLQLKETPILKYELAQLDRGEREAINLALTHNIHKLLIDDFAGRVAAQSLQLTVTGTLGILRDAALAGYLDEAAALRKLMTTNFRLSRSMRSALARDAKDR